mmetsp:Transcript_4942/g.10385  ORF Transcript_4942/g.10385 Transcript_4942/m.10385 type:complete len:213 (-) Transcript_4942:8-646(-)
MDCGTSKRTLKLIPITKMAHGNNGVGHGCTNVGTHDHVDCLPHTNNITTHQTNNNGCGGAGGLQQHSGENANHHRCHRICIISQNVTSCAAANNFSSAAQHFKTQKEEVKEEEQETKASEDDGPLAGSVDAARGAHLPPCRVTNLLSLFLKEVRVAEMCGAGHALLAGTDFFGVLGLFLLIEVLLGFFGTHVCCVYRSSPALGSGQREIMVA